MINLDSKKVSTQLLSNVDRITNWTIQDQFMAGCKIDISVSHYSDSAYSYSDHSGGYCICLGPIYPIFFPDVKYHIFNDVTEDFKKQKIFYDGVNYHELGHILWSPFSYFFEEVRKYKARNFIKEFFNVIEDNVIEDRMMLYYPESSDPILFVRQYFNNPILLNDLQKCIATRPNSGMTFINYMLLHLRGNQVLPPYPIWDDHAVFLDKAYNTIKTTLNGEERARLSIKLALIVLKYLDEEDTSEDEKTFGEDGEPSDSDKEREDPDMSGTSMSPSMSSHDSSMEPVDKVASPPPARSDGEEHKKPESDKEDIKALKQQADYGFHYPHKYIYNVKCSASESSYNAIRSECNNILSSTLKTLRRMKTRALSDVQHFTSSGDVDMSTIHIPYNPNKFCVTNIYGEEVDAILYLVQDLSGSMGYSKCKYCGKAMLTMCECLDKLKIPFAIFGFTENYSVCETVVLKDTKESYKSKKSNVVMVHDRLRVPNASIWTGNIDEVNIANLCERLLKEPHKDKFLVVLSDGETCGSEKTLHDVVQHYASKGITTLGIGVRTDAVDKIYPNHITFMDDKDLEGLPSFLGKYLVNNLLVKRGK